MKDEIIQELALVETRENVRILYACESGSRAWGFPSQDSDYDVRFIYIHPLDIFRSLINVMSLSDLLTIYWILTAGIFVKP